MASIKEEKNKCKTTIRSGAMGVVDGRIIMIDRIETFNEFLPKLLPLYNDTYSWITKFGQMRNLLRGYENPNDSLHTFNISSRKNVVPHYFTLPKCNSFCFSSFDSPDLYTAGPYVLTTEEATKCYVTVRRKDNKIVVTQDEDHLDAWYTPELIKDFRFQVGSCEQLVTVFEKKIETKNKFFFTKIVLMKDKKEIKDLGSFDENGKFVHPDIDYENTVFSETLTEKNIKVVFKNAINDDVTVAIKYRIVQKEISEGVGTLNELEKGETFTFKLGTDPVKGTIKVLLGEEIIGTIDEKGFVSGSLVEKDSSFNVNNNTLYLVFDKKYKAGKMDSVFVKYEIFTPDQYVEVGNFSILPKEFEMDLQHDTIIKGTSKIYKEYDDDNVVYLGSVDENENVIATNELLDATACVFDTKTKKLKIVLKETENIDYDIALRYNFLDQYHEWHKDFFQVAFTVESITYLGNRQMSFMRLNLDKPIDYMFPTEPKNESDTPLVVERPMLGSSFQVNSIETRKIVARIQVLAEGLELNHGWHIIKDREFDCTSVNKVGFRKLANLINFEIVNKDDIYKAILALSYPLNAEANPFYPMNEGKWLLPNPFFGKYIRYVPLIDIQLAEKANQPADVVDFDFIADNLLSPICLSHTDLRWMAERFDYKIDCREAINANLKSYGWKTYEEMPPEAKPYYFPLFKEEILQDKEEALYHTDLKYNVIDKFSKRHDTYIMAQLQKIVGFAFEDPLPSIDFAIEEETYIENKVGEEQDFDAYFEKNNERIENNEGPDPLVNCMFLNSGITDAKNKEKSKFVTLLEEEMFVGLTLDEPAISLLEIPHLCREEIEEIIADKNLEAWRADIEGCSTKEEFVRLLSKLIVMRLTDDEFVSFIDHNNLFINPNAFIDSERTEKEGLTRYRVGELQHTILQELGLAGALRHISFEEIEYLDVIQLEQMLKDRGYVSFKDKYMENWEGDPMPEDLSKLEYVEQYFLNEKQYRHAVKKILKYTHKDILPSYWVEEDRKWPGEDLTTEVNVTKQLRQEWEDYHKRFNEVDLDNLYERITDCKNIIKSKRTVARSKVTKYNTAITAEETAKTGVVNAMKSAIVVKKQELEVARQKVRTAETNLENAKKARDTAQINRNNAAAKVPPAEQAVIAAEPPVVAQQQVVTTKQVIFNQKAEVVVTKQGIVTDKQGIVTDKQGIVANRQVVVEAKQADLDAIEEGGDTTTAETELTTAETELTTAETELTTAETELAIAETGLVTAKTEKTSAQTVLTTEQGKLTTLQNTLNTKKAALTAAQNTLKARETDLTNAKNLVIQREQELQVARDNEAIAVKNLLDTERDRDILSGIIKKTIQV